MTPLILKHVLTDVILTDVMPLNFVSPPGQHGDLRTKNGCLLSTQSSI